MTIPLTIEGIKADIKEAIAAGVPDNEIDDLRDCLKHLQSTRFSKKSTPKPNVREFERDGKTIIHYSTSRYSSIKSDDMDS